MLPLLSATALAATITVPAPADSFWNADLGASQAPVDVVLPGEDVPVAFTLLAGETATLSGPAAGPVTWETTSPACADQGDGTWACEDVVPADATGLWTLQATGAAPVSFVVSGGHPALWLPSGDPGVVWDEYAALDVPTDCDDAVYTGPSSQNTDPAWVRACAWRYLLGQAVPAYLADQPANKLAAADARGYGVALERLALAALLSGQDPDGSAGLVGQKDAQYLAAVRSWGGYLVDVTDQYGVATWRQLPSPAVAAPLDDLERERLLVGLAVAYDWTFPRLTADERRKWRDVLAREANDLEASLIDPDPLSSYPHQRLRQLRNDHFAWRYAALGIVAAVLDDELSTTGAGQRWLDRADGFFGELFASGFDGSDHQGIWYGQYGWTAILRWLEADRLVDPYPPAYEGSWVTGLPRFVAAMTWPNGQRVTFSDGWYADDDMPSSTYARLAGEAADQGRDARLAQRLAMLGHNKWTYAENRRDVLDVLWYDDTVAPMSDADLASQPTHFCSRDTGWTSLRTDWGKDATELVARTGRTLGGHDDPDVGTFTMYGDGHLVTDDLMNQIAKRTALQSTLLLAGHGQHGDWHTAGVEPPDNTDGSTDENGSFTVAWLDASGAARAGTTNVAVDLVGFGVDMTQLYRYDYPGDDFRWREGTPVGWFTNVETNGLTLSSVKRYFLWLGGRVLVADRFDASAPLRVDLHVQSDAQDANELPVSCPVAPQGAGYRYADATGKTLGLSFYLYGSSSTCDAPSEFPCIRCEAGSASCPDGVTLANQLNLGQWTPVAASACPDPITMSSSTVAQLDTSVGGSGLAGRLQVTSLDGLASTVEPTPVNTGSSILGWHLHRTQTLDHGSFLTGLQPYTGSAPTPLAAKAVKGGRMLSVPLGTPTATVLVTDPRQTQATDGGKTPNLLVGDVGAFVEASSRIAAAELLHGTRLDRRKQTLLKASQTASVSATWGADAVWGTVDEATTPTDVWVWLDKRTVSRVEVTTPDGVTTTVAATSSSGGVTFRVPGRSTFRIVSGKTSTAAVASTCF